MNWWLFCSVRVGFLSGPKTLVNRITLHMQVSVVHVSGMSQVSQVISSCSVVYIFCWWTSKINITCRWKLFWWYVTDTCIWWNTITTWPIRLIFFPSIFQALLVPILDKMGYDGFLDHTKNIADFYEKKRDMCLAAAEKHLKGKTTIISADFIHPSTIMTLKELYWLPSLVQVDYLAIIASGTVNNKLACTSRPDWTGL